MELPSLPSRPRAEVLNVGDILSYAKSGHLRVPSFQTGLRWKGSHVADLFDSILRGFPIGGLLLWQREAPAAQLAFGPVSVAAPARADAKFIVDGQQRVTALVGALLHPDDQPLGGVHALWVNLLDGNFATRRKLPEARSPWVPVNLMGTRRRLQHWARTAKFGDQTEEVIDRAFQIEESIIRYELPAYIVQDADERALRLIFSRVNASGVPLREPEVFQALFGHEDEAKPLELLSVELDRETGFGRLPDAWLLRCLKAIAELAPKLNFDEHEPPPPELIVNASAALQAAIRFLQYEAGFVHAKVLPYRFPLIILSRFFHLHPKPHPRSRTLLTRWIWRGALAKEHGDSSNANVAAHLKEIGSNEHETVQRLLARVPKESPLPSARGGWYGQAAATRLHAAAMLAAEPIDASSGRAWELEQILQYLSEHQIGQAFVRPLEGDHPQIAARVFAPTTSARELVAATDEVLFSLGIEDDAATALRRGDAEAFISARAQTLDARLARLVELRAGPLEDDRTTIREMLAG